MHWCTYIWTRLLWDLAVIQMKTQKGERTVVHWSGGKIKREMMRGRTDRDGGRWCGWKNWARAWVQGIRGPLSIRVCVSVCERDREAQRHVCLSMNAFMFLYVCCSHTVYTYLSAYFSLCVFLCWKESYVEWEILCAVPDSSITCHGVELFCQHRSYFRNGGKESGGDKRGRGGWEGTGKEGSDRGGGEESAVLRVMGKGDGMRVDLRMREWKVLVLCRCAFGGMSI